VRTLGIHGDERDALQQSLDQLVSEGQLVEQRRGHYAVPGADPELLTGRLTLHRDGYGFVIPDRPVPGMEGDIYIPRSSAVDAMHGDRVLVRLGRIQQDGRTEGRIDRVLRRQQAYVVGKFRFDRRGSWVIPHDDRVRHEILIPPGRSSHGSHGLVRKCDAQIRAEISGAAGDAETSTSGGVSGRSSSAAASPSTPTRGSYASITTTSIPPSRIAASASRIPVVATTAWPATRSSSAHMPHVSGSVSTSKILPTPRRYRDRAAPRYGGG
jgi:hypothetical protein